MATAESVKSKIQGLIDQSNATTGNSDTDLTTAVGALIAGFGQGGGGGGVESGEITVTAYRVFSVPVTSKKSHILVYPKVIEDSTHSTGRISYFLVVDGLFVWQRRPTSASYLSTAPTSVFGDDKITVNDDLGVPYNLGDYYWYAW